MQLEEIISTAARSNLAGNGISTVIKPEQVPQVKRGYTDTVSSGAIKKSESVDRKGESASEALNDVIQEMRQYQGWGNFNIGFDRDDATNSLVVKIIDRETGETLRQIPPDQILRIRQHMQEAIGLVFDDFA